MLNKMQFPTFTQKIDHLRGCTLLHVIFGLFYFSPDGKDMIPLCVALVAPAIITDHRLQIFHYVMSSKWECEYRKSNLGQFWDSRI